MNNIMRVKKCLTLGVILSLSIVFSSLASADADDELLKAEKTKREIQQFRAQQQQQFNSKLQSLNAPRPANATAPATPPTIPTTTVQPQEPLNYSSPTTNTQQNQDGNEWQYGF